MIISINIPEHSNSAITLPAQLAKLGSDEVVLIELQGSLDVESVNDGARDNQLVGKLRIDDSTSKPTLIIGHHLLEGQITNLPKPLAVLLRAGEHATPHWDMITVVKRKIVFSKRPMPIAGPAHIGVGGLVGGFKG